MIGSIASDSRDSELIRARRSDVRGSGGFRSLFAGPKLQLETRILRIDLDERALESISVRVAAVNDPDRHVAPTSRIAMKLFITRPPEAMELQLTRTSLNRLTEVG
jgi:hypothetical protein